MVDDYGLLRTEQGSAAIQVAVPNVATILDTLATVLGVYHAVLHKHIFQYISSH